MILGSALYRPRLRSAAGAFSQPVNRLAWPNWLRDRNLLTDLLNRELLTMDTYNDLTRFSQVAGKWPPPVAARWNLLMLRLTRTGFRLD
jgi:hypothetical protein